jgi:2-furoyl-CoA dehydrogenase FAD binding subunit
VKPASFDYVRAGTVDEVLETLAEQGSSARILAGGQSLLPMLNMRLARPAVLVDIMRLENLARIETDGALKIGAAVRQASLLEHPKIAATHPLLSAALPWVGHWQTRARGTICGSVAHADPSAEIPLCLLALKGRVHLRSRRARRSLSAEDFFTGMMSTARTDEEMITGLEFPARSADTGYAFAEVGRRHGDFAMAACAAVVDGRGIRLTVGGVADRPMAREWPILEGAALDDALNAFAFELGARDDVHASARYRRDLVRKLGRRVIEEAFACRS